VFGGDGNPERQEEEDEKEKPGPKILNKIKVWVRVAYLGKAIAKKINIKGSL